MDTSIFSMEAGNRQEIHNLSARCSDSVMDKDAFIDEFIDRADCGILVAVFDQKLVGFLIYEKSETNVHVHNLIVDVDFRRMGFGKALVNHLQKCIPARNYSVSVRESHTGVQLFFKRLDFKCSSIILSYFMDEDLVRRTTHREDAYFFEKENTRIMTVATRFGDILSERRA